MYECSEFIDVFPDDFDDVIKRTEPSQSQTQILPKLCYGRGLWMKDINLPRLPQELSTGNQLNDGAFKSINRGRGRAKVLTEQIEKLKASAAGVDASRNESVSSINVFDLEYAKKHFVSFPKKTEVKPACKNDDNDKKGDLNTDFLAFKKNIDFRPLLRPAPKCVPGINSEENFPTLGQCGASTDASVNRSETKTKVLVGAEAAVHSGNSSTNNSASSKISKEPSLPNEKSKKKKKKKSSKERGNFLEELAQADKHSKKIFVDKNDNHSLPLAQTADYWTVTGDNVIELSGLPLTGEFDSLYSLLPSFGAVLHIQRIEAVDHSKMRIRFSSTDACNMAVDCLHLSESITPDSVVTCVKIED